MKLELQQQPLASRTGIVGRKQMLSRIQAGHRIHFAKKDAERKAALRARNAYRAAAGLPLILE